MLCCKKVQILCCVVILTACGFQPVFKKGTESILESEMRHIKINPIKDRIGQQLRNHLVHDVTPLGGSRTKKYILDVTLNESKQNLAIKKSEVATRANLHLTAKYEIRLSANGALLTAGQSQITTSFNILSQSFGTIVAEQNARSRAIREISSDIGIKIASFFKIREDSSKKK